MFTVPDWRYRSISKFIGTNDSFSGSTIIIAGGTAELHLYVQGSGNTMSLYVRGKYK